MSYRCDVAAQKVLRKATVAGLGFYHAQATPGVGSALTPNIFLQWFVEDVNVVRMSEELNFTSVKVAVML